MAAKGGKCVATKSLVKTVKLKTPLGLFGLSACGQGIHSLEFLEEMEKCKDENVCPVETSENLASLKGSHGDDTPLGTGILWLTTFFGKPSQLPKTLPPFCLGDNYTEFERKVWMTLATRVGFGETITYAGLAAEVENPKASRAVGTAMKKNPIPLIIPCHRVVRSDGQIGNYSGGKHNDFKVWLLKHEKSIP